MTMRLGFLLVSIALFSFSGRAGADELFDGSKKPKEGSLGQLLEEKGGTAPKPENIIGLDNRFWATIKAGDSKARTRISSLGMSIEEVDGGIVRGIATHEVLGLLAAEGFTITEKTPLHRFHPEDFPDQDGAYHNFGEAQAALAEIASAHPDLVTLFQIGKSVEGRNITALRFGPKSKNLPGIAFLGAHHAREHLSTEVPLKLAQWLAENSGRPDVKTLLETREVYIIPMVNPDGVEYDIATGRYRWQRKNMRKNGDGSFGVDLNRNYDFRWGGQGASGNPDSDTYYGSAPFSEPETQAVRDFLVARKNVRIVLSYHTFSELILYPWGGVDEPISDTRALAAFKTMAQTTAGMTGYRPMQSSGLYIATGDTCDWAWEKLKMFCFTFELTPKSNWEGGFYPGAGKIDSTFKKNIDPALYLIDLADDPYRASSGKGDSL